jgi:hypothetical protein
MILRKPPKCDNHLSLQGGVWLSDVGFGELDYGRSCGCGPVAKTKQTLRHSAHTRGPATPESEVRAMPAKKRVEGPALALVEVCGELFLSSSSRANNLVANIELHSTSATKCASVH